MSEAVPRCPFCGNVIKIEATFWSRLGLRPSRVACGTCRQQSESRDARTMGESYHDWAELFRGKLMELLAKVPVLSEEALKTALGNPNAQDVKVFTAMEDLVRTCLRHQRTAVTEMARGREATLDVVPLCNETTKALEMVAILGTSSQESGSKEWEQIVARSGPAEFVLYTHPGTAGAEPRVKRAVHGKDGVPWVGAEIKPVAAFRSRRAGGAVGAGW
jgi:hypothetical protein